LFSSVSPGEYRYITLKEVTTIFFQILVYSPFMIPHDAI